MMNLNLKLQFAELHIIALSLQSAFDEIEENYKLEIDKKTFDGTIKEYARHCAIDHADCYIDKFIDQGRVARASHFDDANIYAVLKNLLA